MAEENAKPSVLIFDVKQSGEELAVVLALRRGGEKRRLRAGELRARLKEHGVDWPEFVRALGDFERWAAAPSHRRDFPEYTADRLQLLERLKAQLKVEVNARRRVIAKRRDAAREPKKCVLNVRDRVAGLAKTLDGLTDDLRRQGDAHILGGSAKDMLLSIRNWL